MKNGKFWIFGLMVLFVVSVSASYPASGTCEIMENRSQLPASCNGNIFTIDESVESFDILEVPEGVDIDSFALHQQVFNDSYGEENKFFVRFYAEGGTYKFVANNKEIVVSFQEPQNRVSSLDWAIIALFAILLTILSLGIIFMGNKKQKLLMAIGWGIVLILLIIMIIIMMNPL